MKPQFYESGIVDVKFGENVKIVKPVNIYGCEIGSNCFIGPFVEIQRTVKVGDFTKIQSHTFICELVEIGSHCFIGHGVVFINDPFLKGGPAQGDKNYWRNTKVGDHVSIGSNATIMPVEICNHVVIGAGSVVTKNIAKPGIYAGSPARLLKESKEFEKK